MTIAIIGLLMGLLAPSLGRAREQARRTVCVAQLKHMGLALLLYADDHNGIAPQIGPVVNSISPRELLTRDGVFINLGLLYDKYLAEARIFRCPSAKRHNFEVVPDTMREVKSGLIAGSYAYAVHIPAGQSPKLAVRRQLALAADNPVSAEGGLGLGFYTHRKGYNVLYQDGSANWYDDADESIARAKLYYDDETDMLTYDSLYDANGEWRTPPGGYDDYSGNIDLIRAWKAFCFNEKDPF